MAKIRILIVAGTVVLRRLLADELARDADLEVAGSAASGRIALAKIPQVNPDLLVLDLDLAGAGGQTPLADFHRAHPQLPVVLFNRARGPGAADDLDPLLLDANDYFPGPLEGADPALTRRHVHDELIPRIKQFYARVRQASKAPVLPGPPPPGPSSGRRVEAVVIGASTGGPDALARLLGGLPADFPVPVLVVQHMPPVFTQRLADRLAALAAVSVGEAVSGIFLEPGQVWIAPGDFHLEVARGPAGVRLRTHQGPPENSCRPSADVLFRSAADAFGPGALAVVLTGMGQDGLRGCQRVREAGGQVLVQDAASSVVWGMPGMVARAGLADQVLPLGQLAPEILRRVRRGRSFAPPEPAAPRTDTALRTPGRQTLFGELPGRRPERKI